MFEKESLIFMNKFDNNNLPQKIADIVKIHLVDEGPTTRRINSKVFEITNNKQKHSFLLEMIKILNNTSLEYRNIK